MPTTTSLLTNIPSVFPITGNTIDWKISAKVFTKTLSANTIFSFANIVVGKEIIVRITNTTGNFTVIWPNTISWSDGNAPFQTIGAKTDLYKFVYNGTEIIGSVVQNYFISNFLNITGYTNQITDGNYKVATFLNSATATITGIGTADVLLVGGGGAGGGDSCLSGGGGGGRGGG